MIHLLLALCFCALQHHCFAAYPGSDPYLLFSTWFTLSRVNLDGSNYSVLVDSATNVGIQAVDYHQRLNKAFWTHYRDGTIHQANLDGSDPKVIVINVTRPSGLAVDWVHDNIYYSFGDFGSNTINPNHLAVYNLTTGATFEMTAAINQLYGVFHDLAVDPLEGKLYWTTGSRIVRSSLSGENAEILFSPSCNARYLGLSTNLYWTQSCTGSEESVHCLDLTTLQQTVIVTNNANTFYSDVTAYEDTVYWTLLGRVNSAPVIGDDITLSQVLHIPTISTNFRGIVVVHPDLQPCPAPDCSNNVQSSQDISPMSLMSTNIPTHVESPSPSPKSSDKESSANNNVPLTVGLTVTAVIFILLLLFIAFGIIAIIFKKSNKQRKESILPSAEDTDMEMSQNSMYNISRPAANNRNDERMYPANKAEVAVTSGAPLYEEIDESSFVPNTNNSHYEN